MNNKDMNIQNNIKNKINWNSYYQKWLEYNNERNFKKVQETEKEVRKILNNKRLRDVNWIVNCFNSYNGIYNLYNETSFILRALGKSKQMPEKLFIPILRAAIIEKDPSRNRLFIEPCLRCFGAKKTNKELIEYFKKGSNEEKAGVAHAFYWSMKSNGYDDIGHENIADLIDEINALFLKEFINNTDIEVRQSIISQLSLNPKDYPKEMHFLITKAIKIARASQDDYIKHRIEVQLIGCGPYKAIPT